MIETKRLILRPFTLENAKLLYLILSDKETNTFLPWFTHQTLKQTKQFIKDNYLN